MFQRMVAVPYEEYAQVRGSDIKYVKQPDDQQFFNLEKRYKAQELIQDPYKRMYAQGETLDEMRDLKERMQDRITRGSPTPYRGRAKALFEGVSSFLKFNQRGEIYDDENKIVPDSNVEDLIQYAVRDRRRSIEPTGWAQFTTMMKKHNVPKYALNRYTLDEMSGIPPPTLSKIATATPMARKSDDAMTKRQRRYSESDVTPRKSLSPKKRKVIEDIDIDEVKKDLTAFNTPQRTKLKPSRQRKPNTRYGKKFGFVSDF